MTYSATKFEVATPRHETFQIFGRFQIFSFQIIISKVVGFHLKVTKTQFWTWGVGVFRLFMACFRFFRAELSLMPNGLGGDTFYKKRDGPTLVRN